ncbi:hypothetical protein SLG_35720 [Sphingobium sp. SYK-6]|nr:hypothetical protein SLG_35720 [Sphingobium sp. SYK-6]
MTGAFRRSAGVMRDLPAIVRNRHARGGAWRAGRDGLLRMAAGSLNFSRQSC